MRFQAWACIAVGAFVLAGCGLFESGEVRPDHCEIRVIGVDEWSMHGGGLDAAYRVAGTAGSAATAWLAADTGTEGYISGYGLDVGPGRFDAVVDLQLTGRPRSFLAVLEVQGRRCKDDAPIPGA
jgi:hypothetical protein